MSELLTIFVLRASEALLLASGFSLVIGIIGEYRLPFWHHRLHIYEMLVLIGCAGELIADAGVFLFSEHLQTIQQLRVEALGKLADDADGKALKAISDAKSASDIAGPAKETAGKAKREADAASSKAVEVDRSLAMTQYLISERQVHDPEALIKELKQFAGLSVSFTSYPDDTDGLFICKELVTVAKAAGITPGDVCGGYFILNGQIVTGIAVSGPDDKTMLALAQSLSHAGIYGGVSSGPYGQAPHSPTFGVLIGRRPPFSIGQARPTQVSKKSSPAKK